MALDASTTVFLRGQIERLGPFDVVQFGAGGTGPLVEVVHDDPDGLRVRVPTGADTPLPLTRRARMAEAGWRSADPNDPAVPWEHPADDASEALALAIGALKLGWDSTLGDDLDVRHGNRRAEHDAAMALATLRARYEPLLTEQTGFKPELDGDGDYLCGLEGVRVTVAIRAVVGTPVIVRVSAPTNIGVTVGPELGLFLSRLNLGLAFGRFALDTDHQAVWFEETLLGASAIDDEVRFMVDWVARATAEWGPRLQHMFGGITQRELDPGRLGDLKPAAWRPGAG